MSVRSRVCVLFGSLSGCSQHRRLWSSAITDTWFPSGICESMTLMRNTILEWVLQRLQRFPRRKPTSLEGSALSNAPKRCSKAARPQRQALHSPPSLFSFPLRGPDAPLSPVQLQTAQAQLQVQKATSKGMDSSGYSTIVGIGI